MPQDSYLCQDCKKKFIYTTYAAVAAEPLKIVRQVSLTGNGVPKRRDTIFLDSSCGREKSYHSVE